MPCVCRTDPQNPKLRRVRGQPGRSTLGLSMGLLSGGSLAWLGCSLPSQHAPPCQVP